MLQTGWSISFPHGTVRTTGQPASTAAVPSSSSRSLLLLARLAARLIGWSACSSAGWVRARATFGAGSTRRSGSAAWGWFAPPQYLVGAQGPIPRAPGATQRRLTTPNATSGRHLARFARPDCAIEPVRIVPSMAPPGDRELPLPGSDTAQLGCRFPSRRFARPDTFCLSRASPGSTPFGAEFRKDFRKEIRDNQP